MATAAIQVQDFLAKKGSMPSPEPFNLPSDEEFFASLVNFQWDAREWSLVDAPAPMAASKGEGCSCHGSSKDGCAVRLDPAWFEVDLSLSDFLEVIRMEHQKGRGEE